MTYDELSKINTTGLMTNALIKEVLSTGSGEKKVSFRHLNLISKEMESENVEFVGKPFTLAYNAYCWLR